MNTRGTGCPPRHSDVDNDNVTRMRIVFLPQWYRNPYLGLLDAHLSALGVRVGRFGRSVPAIVWGLLRKRPHVLHLHWLHPFYEAPGRLIPCMKLAFTVVGFTLLRLLGTRIVWTAHNLRNHENLFPRLDRILRTFVLRRAKAVIVHCETAKQLLMATYGLRSDDKMVVIPHGHYGGAYDSRSDRTAARRTLEIPPESLMVLFLGRVRPYKGVLELIDAVRELEYPDVRLVIAGQPHSEDAGDTITRKIGEDPAVRFMPGFVPEEMIQVYMNACDVVALPYRDVLTSGAAVLAMSFGRACVAPRLGCLKDILNDDGAFLYDADDPDGLAGALRAAVASRAGLPTMGTHNLEVARSWDWEGVARQTLNVYRRALHGQRRKG